MTAGPSGNRTASTSCANSYNNKAKLEACALKLMEYIVSGSIGNIDVKAILIYALGELCDTRMNIENQLSGKIINKAKETLITFINSSLYYRDGQKCEVHRQIAEKMIKGEMLRAEDNSILLKLRNS